MNSIRPSPITYYFLAVILAGLAVNIFIGGCDGRARGANIIPPAPAKTLVVPQDSSSAAPASVNQSVSTGEGQIIGKPAPVVSVSLAWTDESLTNTNVAGYHVYYGGGDVAFSNYFTVTNWLKTNGLAEITITNVSPSVEYSVLLNAFDKLGNDSSNSLELTFIAPGYLLSATGTNSFELSFMAFSNHTYTVQSRAPGATAWNSRQAFSNTQGVQTFADPTFSAAFYRLQIQ